jgi:CBS domain-containing protein
MKVKDLMTTDVKCCSEFSSLNTAAKIMWGHDIGCVPIVDKNERLVGMVTDRDICMSAYLQGMALKGALVSTAMSKDVSFCRPEDDLTTAEKLMQEKQIHRLPVIDVQRKLIGIISVNDIAREAASEADM